MLRYYSMREKAQVTKKQTSKSKNSSKKGLKATAVRK
jgi:hypothetical protein